MFCMLDNPDTGIGPLSTAYGPFNIQSPYATGLRGASYFLKTHDSGYGHGGANPGAYQQGGGPDGPTLFLGFPLPDTSTPQGYPNTVVTPDKGLVYYSLSAYTNHADGSLPPGQPIWSFRQPGYPYVYESSQGAWMAINPALNGGGGTWTECDNLGGMVYVN